MAPKFTRETAPNPAVEQLLEDTRELTPKALEHRDKVVEVGVAVLFLVIAIPLAMTASFASGDIGVALVLVLGYALACRVEFALGGGYGVPTQVVFVPMLFA